MMKKSFTGLLALVTFLMLLLTTGHLSAPLFAQPSILDQVLNTRESLVEVRAENSDVYRAPQARAARDPKTGRILIMQNVKQASYNRTGAGVVIHPSGVIVTNAHIIYRADRIRVVLRDGQALEARIVKFVNDLDLALLKISPQARLPAVILADSDLIRLGDEIMTVGHSTLLNETVSGGKVIGLGTGRSAGLKGRRSTDLIQTSFNLYEGDSGGPLFDAQGRLIGLMTAKETSADHSSFAVPSNRIAQYLNNYLNSSRADTLPSGEQKHISENGL